MPRYKLSPEKRSAKKELKTSFGWINVNKVDRKKGN